MTVTYDHSKPNPHFKAYLDADPKTKYKGQTKCVCKDCIDRRYHEDSKKVSS